jgi:hypothetical protein
MPTNVVPQTLGELLGQDLSGFRLQGVFFLRRTYEGETRRSFLASFIDLEENEREVFCVDLDVLKRMEDQLPNEATKIHELLVLFHQQEGIALLLNHPHFSLPENRERAPAIQIMDEEEFLWILENQEKPFRWTLSPQQFLPPPTMPKRLRLRHV